MNSSYLGVDQGLWQFRNIVNKVILPDFNLISVNDHLLHPRPSPPSQKIKKKKKKSWGNGQHLERADGSPGRSLGKADLTLIFFVTLSLGYWKRNLILSRVLDLVFV